MVGRPHRGRGRGYALTSRLAPVRGRGGRIALAAASTVYLAVLASLTLGPQPEGASGGLEAIAAWLGQFPLTAWATYPVLEFTANIALFAPVGILWVMWTGTRRWALAAGVGLAMSLAIELTQALVLSDRVPDVRDVIANTLGAALGAVAMIVLARATARRRRARTAA